MYRFIRSVPLVLAFLVLLLAPTSRAQAQFTDVAASVGINFVHQGLTGDMGMGAGGAWFDYDNDGDLDLYLVQRTGANMLFENNAGSFTDVATTAGVTDASHDGAAVVAADFNNDGCKDLYLANSNEDVLFQNNCDGTFTDITTGSGLEASGARRGTSATVGDYNNDGLLDLYVSHHMPVAGYGVPDDSAKDQDYLYHNNGDGTFTDVTDDLLGSDRENASFIGAWTDYDKDGDLDIFLIRDCGFDGAGPLELYRNDGGTDGITDWTFTEVGASVGANYCQNGMGIAVGDFDRNGFMDIFTTDNGSAPGTALPERAGSLLLSNSGGVFTDATDTFGVSSLNFSWGANFFDYNQDGWQDVFMAGGALNDASAMVSTKLWRNDSGVATDVTVGSGAEDLTRSRAGYYGDYDGDGDADLFLFNYGGTARLFRNDNANGNNWLVVDLQGVTSNRDGIGAKIELVSASGTQHFEVRNGSSLGGGDDTGAYFGIGSDASITSMTITWPSGTMQTINNPGINQRMLVVEGVTGGLFTDVSTSSGVAMTHDGASFPVVGDPRKGTGAAWFDYDLDGDLDLYTTMRTQANLLWRNNGDGTFTNVAAAAGVENASGDGAGVVVADYDNDGDKDLFLANGNEDVLYRNNGDGTFTDITAGSGLDATQQHRASSASWGDYDGDGLVDLYLSNHTAVSGSTFPGVNGQDYIFHNNGDDTFTDVSDMLMGADRVGRSFIGGWTDFDKDGDLDIFKVNDCPTASTDPTEFFRNDGGTNGLSDWTFTEISTSIGADWCQQGMGLAMGDYDRDLDTDLFFTDNGNTSPTSANVRAGSVFLRNDGATYSDQSDANMTANTQLSWGANFFDYDLDGWLDLYMAAGGMTDDQTVMHSVLWENNGDGTFGDVSAQSGGLDTPERTRTSVFGDYDGDGDPDMFLVNYEGAMQLFRNENSNGNNWVIIDLEGVTSNRDGIGAKIEVTTGDAVTQYHEVRSGSSLGGGDDIGAYFGLGTNGSITNVSVTWPSGTVQNVGSVGINQRMTITETAAPSGGLFTDVSGSAGINAVHTGDPADMPIGTGSAWMDYDNDGDLDLYMTNRVGSNWLYQNNGGTFVDVAAAAGVQDASGEGAGVAAADYNNDGCVDLFLANSYEDVLFENNCDGTFTDITAGSGLNISEDRRGTSASWGDYDNDGLLDLYVANHMPAPVATFTGDSEQDYIFHNNGDGTFTDVSDMLMGTDRVGRSFIGGWTDYDNDGDIDVLTIRDCPFGANSGPMRLYRNDGGTDGVSAWTFTQVAETVGVDWCQNGMGLAVGDYNRDGWMDLFFTDNGAGTDAFPNERTGSVLLRNDNGIFTETTDLAQVDNNKFSWGANFFDYDLDGFQDLYMVAGAMDPLVSLEGILWQNDGDGTFTDVSLASGGLDDPFNTRTSAYADYDGDGDMDMFLVNYGQQAKLFRNDNANFNNHVIVDLQGTVSNRDGIGARVELTTPDGFTQHFEVRSGSSLGAGDDRAAYFGIGSNASVTSLVVKWPSGIVQDLGSVGINQRHLVVEEAPIPTELFTDVTSAAGLSVMHTEDDNDMGMGSGAAWFDYDNDGDQDLYMTQRLGANHLFQNNGGVFTDVAAAAGVQDASNDGAGVAVADFDNDGDKDLFLANGDNDVLFRNNGDGTFTDITAGSGLESSEERRGTSASWGDYDGDGFVDLFVANHMAIAGNLVTGGTEQVKAQDYIYRNNGDGTFTDVSVMLLGANREGMSFIGGWSDYDTDGDLDIFLIHDCPFDGTAPQLMYRNDGGTDGATDWTFSEVSATVNVDFCQNGMGLAVGDYDRDGDFDFFFSDNGGNANVPGGQQSRPGTILLRNDNGIFADATDIAGVSSVAWSWGANFFDYDLDGFQDLYLAAGAMNSEDPVESVLWQNDGDGTFTDVSTTSGGLNDPARTRTSVYADYDEDGDMDMFLVNYAGDTKLYRNNNNNGNNWVIFDLEGVTSNRDGIGARLELQTSDGATQYYETRSGSSLGGGDDLGAYFGIANAGSITNLTITWPSGIVQVVNGLAINQRHLIVEEGVAGPTLAVTPGSVDFGDVQVGGSSTPTMLTLTNNGLESLDVTAVNITGENAGDFSHTFAAPVTIAGGATSTFDVAFSPSVTGGASVFLPEGVLYRVNAGGSLVDDWEEDSAGSVSPYLLAGSTNIETDNNTPVLDASVPAGTPADLFTTMRIDANQPDPMMEWDFPVTIGEPLEVRLYFVEMSRCSVGSRVFDVEIEGTLVLDNLDVFAEAGSTCNTGIMRTFTVTPLDANLDINFPLENGKPSILAGIEILGSDGTSSSPRTAQLTVDHTGANASQTVELDGNAITSTGGGSVLAVTPEAVDFGQVEEGASSAPTTLTLTNTGADAIDVTSVTMSGTNFGDFSHDLAAPVTIAGGATSTFDVTFSPVAPSSPEMLLPEGVLYRVNAGGDLTDDWEEDTSGMASPYLLAGSTNIETDDNTPTLDATVPAGTPLDLFMTKRIDANQADPMMEWDFPVTAGEEIEVRLFFVEMSRCSAGNRIFDVEIEGTVVLDNFDIFTEAGGACNVGTMRSITVTPTDANLDINFPLQNGKPSALAAIEILGAGGGVGSSPRSAQLTINHTGINGSLNVDLSGEALSSGGPTLAVTPVEVDFGVVEIDASSAPTTLTLTNNGAEAIDVNSVTISGTNAGDFSHDFSAPLSVAAGETSTFDVTFTPTASAGPAPLAPGDVLYRVNSGGALIDDWIKDSDGSPSPYILPGATNVETDTTPATLDSTVPAGTPTDLFQSVRIDANQADPMMEWDFPVTAGQVIEVRLYFAELSRCSDNNRIFDVEIEGTIVLDNFDIHAEAGSACNVGIMRSFEITPTDANLDINFPLVNGKPSSVAAIEIIESDGGTLSPRSAQLVIDHSGVNGPLTVELAGVGSSESTGGNVAPVAAFSTSIADLVATFTDASTDSDGTIASWSWDLGDGNTSTDQSPVHTYAAYGTYTVALTVTDDLGATGTTSEEIVVADPNATGAFLEVGGLVSMEAESFFTNTDRSAHMWVSSTANPGFSGTAAMSGDPNDDTTFRKQEVANSPEMTYDVDFTSTGTYYVWVRVFAASDDDNTFHAGLAGNPSASKGETTTFGSWVWTNVNTKGGLLTLGVTAAGVQEINLWMREDGISIDKIVLTSDVNFVPTGTGPAESPRASATAAKGGFGKDMLSLDGDGIVDLPTEFGLGENYPNPFNPTTTIQFALPEEASVTLEVFDTMGRRVATLISSQLSAGRYQAQWNGRNSSGASVASGMYLYRIKAGTFVETKTMLLMK